MREQKSAKTMYPRFDSNERMPCELRSFASTGLLLLSFILSACSSSPSSQSVATSASANSEATSVGKSPRGKSQDVEESAAALVPEEPLPPEAVQQFDAAVVHMNAGDDAAAEQAFRNLASSYPKYSGALVNLGILQAKAGRLEEAEATFKAALERHATNATALNQLGIVYRKLGRFQDADQAYQQATQADPNYANAYFNLGVLCDLYLQQPERALQAYERYLELSPSPDARVNAWVNELKKRIGAEPRAARSE
jgi:Flp pilus assembly protein TadD